MSTEETPQPAFAYSWRAVFSSGPDEEFINLRLGHPVTYFVGRNGSGKSKTAKLIGNESSAHYLSTDRLSGLMNFQSTGFTSFFDPQQQRGIPLGLQEQEQMRQFAKRWGTATDELYVMREEPEVAIRVAAFVRRALGRTIELREQSGLLEPFVRMGRTEYSLIKDEGHGLRELVVLLAATYRADWKLLVVDEPELHLHPSMARLWLAELKQECTRSGRQAIVVTHEPTLIRPLRRADLDAIVLFAPTRRPMRVGDATLEAQEDRITGSLAENPELTSSLVFSPRPVLVEGKHDVAAMSTVMNERFPPEQAAQTDFVDCGGTTGVATWFEVATKLEIDVRAVADLDGLYDGTISRTLDRSAAAAGKLRDTFKVEPATFSEVLRPLHNRASQEGVAGDPRSKAEWTARLSGDGHAGRRDALLEVLRDAGIWLHPQGRLEQVFGISSKGVAEARTAAMEKTPLDDVARWCAYSIDLRGDVRTLLDVAVERVASTIITSLGVDPDTEFDSPIGASSEFDRRLVDLISLGAGRFRLIVREPRAFAGWWTEFKRTTPLSDLALREPPQPADSAAPTRAD